MEDLLLCKVDLEDIHNLVDLPLSMGVIEVGLVEVMEVGVMTKVKVEVMAGDMEEITIINKKV
jgi:hypothetical protein